MFGDCSDRLVDDGAMRGYGAAVVTGRRSPLAFVCGHSGPNRLYQPAEEGESETDRQLVDVACGIVADTGRHAIGAAAADFDADGCEEVYVHNADTFAGEATEGDLLLDRTDPGREVWQDVFALDSNAGRENFRAGRSVAAVDRLGTGQYGVAIASCDSPLRFYELGEDGELTDMADALGIDIACMARSACAGPLVSEGMDLYLGVDDGPNRLFENDAGSFNDVAPACGLTDPAGAPRGVALIGRDVPPAETAEGGTVPASAGGFDLAVGNWEGPGRIFRTGKNGFEDIAPSEFSQPSRRRTVVAADFDNDGHVELFCNCLGEPNDLFRRIDGTWQAADPGAATDPRGFGTGAVTADFDGDGTLELLVVRGEAAAQPLGLYAVDNDNDWLRIAPRTVHGAPARGAVVELETDDGWQRRLVDPGSSYLCQSEPVAHFGLGSASPRQGRVWWPGGHKRTVDITEANRKLRIDHPRRQ